MTDKPLKQAIVETQARYTTNDAYIRINRGYKLREDLVKACKRIALEENRLLYQVMEEALETYIKSRLE